jgi:DNA-binding transcriptional ArsR family regulator
MRTNFLCLTPTQAARVDAATPSAAERELAVRRLGALSDPTRLRVALVLASTSELCVRDTATLLDLPIKLVSHHMRCLAERGLATKERDGKLIRYRLTDEARQILDAAFDRPRPVQVRVEHARPAKAVG